MKLENFEKLRSLLNYNAKQRGELPKHEAGFDQELSLKRYAKDQAVINRNLKILAPTGKDNEPAAFMARNIQVVAAYRVGARHTMLILKEGKKKSTIVAGYMWHNPDHPAVITEGAASFSPGIALRLPIHPGCKINIVYRPMRLEGKDVLTGKATAKIEILALSPC